MTTLHMISGIFYIGACILGLRAMVASMKHPAHSGELSAVIIMLSCACAMTLITELYPDHKVLGHLPVKEIRFYLIGTGIFAFNWHIIRATKNWKHHEN